MRLKVLDLFSGTGSATQAYEDRGHEVLHIDITDAYGPVDIQMDVRKFSICPWLYLPLGWKPDVIWASPPCQAFSMSGAGERRWHYLPKGEPHEFFGPRVPKDKVAKRSIELVLATLHTIELLEPKWWWMENPTAGLRTMGFMQLVPGPVTITYCQYGDMRMKPTDLWGYWPRQWKPRPRCNPGDTCHEAAGRGVYGGTKRLRTATERGMVPYELSKTMCRAVERATKKRRAL